jgi:hypothetical protein
MTFDDLHLDLERSLSELPYGLTLKHAQKTSRGKVRGRRNVQKAEREEVVTGDIRKGEGADVE